MVAWLVSMLGTFPFPVARHPLLQACRRSQFAARLARGDPITNPVVVSERSLEGDGPEVACALAHYPRIRVPRIERIERGLIHQTFLVEDSDDRYVLQRLNPVFSPDVHENIAAVTERLALHGISTLHLCRTEAGALYADLADAGRWRLMTYVPGVAFDRCPSVAHARAAATLVGRFHSALDGLEHDFRALGFAFHDAVGHFRDLDMAIDSHRDIRYTRRSLSLRQRSVRQLAPGSPSKGYRIAWCTSTSSSTMFFSSRAAGRASRSP